MAFCRNCGTQLDDGAKFCPKCGQVVGGASVPQQEVIQPQTSVEQEKKEKLKIWQKVLCFLIGPVGILCGLILLIRKKTSMAKSALLLGALGTIFNVMLTQSGGNSSNGNMEKAAKTEESVQETSITNDASEAEESIDETAVSEIANQIAEEGYNDGYQCGFSLGTSIANPQQEVIKSNFSIEHGAPSTPEMAELFRIYKENYERGYREGQKAGQ